MQRAHCSVDIVALSMLLHSVLSKWRAHNGGLRPVLLPWTVSSMAFTVLVLNHWPQIEVFKRFLSSAAEQFQVHSRVHLASLALRLADAGNHLRALDLMVTNSSWPLVIRMFATTKPFLIDLRIVAWCENCDMNSIATNTICEASPALQFIVIIDRRRYSHASFDPDELMASIARHCHSIRTMRLTTPMTRYYYHEIKEAFADTFTAGFFSLSSIKTLEMVDVESIVRHGACAARLLAATCAAGGFHGCEIVFFPRSKYWTVKECASEYSLDTVLEFMMAFLHELEAIDAVNIGIHAAPRFVLRLIDKVESSPYVSRRYHNDNFESPNAYSNIRRDGWKFLLTPQVERVRQRFSAQGHSLHFEMKSMSTRVTELIVGINKGF